jgi:hypothetical protein
MTISFINWVSKSTHHERLAADRNLAERKFQFDKDQSEKKLASDKALVVWRRRYEIAEQVLTSTYEARDILNWVRTTAIMSGEGETRKATESEEEKLRKKRNIYFVPIERLTRETKTLSGLHALQFTAGAHFGENASKPLFTIIKICEGIDSAARILIQVAEVEDELAQSQGLIPLKEELGWGKRPDTNDEKLRDAIAQIEAVCRPVLSERPPG